MATTSAAAFAAHARDLAAAFDVRLIESAVVKPEEALAVVPYRIVLCGTIIDETTYAVAMHEIGHLVAPLGILHPAGVPHASAAAITRLQEEAAWAWARHYALEWTPVMEQVSSWCEGTYAPPPPKPAPQPRPRPRRVNWDEWT